MSSRPDGSSTANGAASRPGAPPPARSPGADIAVEGSAAPPGLDLPGPGSSRFDDPRALVLIGLVAALAGVAVGIIGGAFRQLLFDADVARRSLLSWAHDQAVLGFLLVIIVVVACVVAARLIVLVVPRASGSGIQDVEAVWRGEMPATPWQVLPAKFLGGLLSIGAGLALGREGPTVHLGAAIGSVAGRRFRMSDEDVRVLQTAMGGAGLGVAFNAPLGGALFVFEEVTKVVRLRLTLATLIGAAAAIAASRMIVGAGPDFLVHPVQTPEGWTLLVFIAFGLVTGLVGAWYNRAIMFALGVADRLRRVPPIAQAGVIGAAVGVFLWFDPLIATGGGDALTQKVLNGGIALGGLALFFVVRFFLGPLSYASQTPGGLFAPLLAVGALWGAVFQGFVGAFISGPGLGGVAFAIVGMSALFAAIVRAPLTGVVLIVEMTATTTLVVPMLAASFGAVVATTVLGSEPIYDSLERRMLAGLATTRPRSLAAMLASLARARGRDSLERAYLRLHAALYVWSGGRLGHRLVGVPSLILWTTGRRSGIARPAVLIYARDGDAYAVVASNHGFDRPPAWLLNIRADPSVRVQVGRRRAPARARVVEADDPDYERLWTLVNDTNHQRYSGYQAHTTRPIPVVVVTPTEPLR